MIDVVPGMDGYTPLWRVTMLTWRDGADPRTLRSASAVRAAIRTGELTARRTSAVVNRPVLGFGQELTQGFAKGEDVEYLDLGPIKLAPGNLTAPIWVVENGTADQHNIIDVLPGRARVYAAVVGRHGDLEGGARSSHAPFRERGRGCGGRRGCDAHGGGHRRQLPGGLVRDVSRTG